MNNTMGRRWRSVLALVGGLVATAALSVGTDAVMRATGVFPPLGRPMSDALFALATAYRVAYTVLGGYITAALAPGKPMTHVLVLAAIGLLLATAGAAAAWNRPDLGPKWYPLSLVITAIPCVWAGGKLWAWRAESASRPRDELAQLSQP